MRKRIARWARSLRRRSRADLLRRFGLAVLALVLVVLGWGVYRVIGYVYESPRFEVSSVSVSGLTRVSEGEILARAALPPGTNILHVDLEQTRESIESLRWVKHARVQRIWPREIAISVNERDPIALARIDGEIHQVDAEGIILPLDTVAEADFPILEGLLPDDLEGNRARIEIYMATLDLIGEEMLSEVHITGAGEVSVVPSDSPILVDLGLDRHPERWETYLRHRRRIFRDYPGASRVDLRFEDQGVIIRMGDSQPAGRVSWDEEAKLL